MLLLAKADAAVMFVEHTKAPSWQRRAGPVMLLLEG